MDIQEMHVWFRQYAQQMGMQNVRAILPEQIDVLINTSISDTVNEIVRTNVGLTNDRVITDNSKIGQINALRTLFRSSTLNLNNEFGMASPPFDKGLKCLTLAPMFETANARIKDCLYLIDMAVRYGMHHDLYFNDTTYQILPAQLGDASYTSYYPIRTIESMFLADTLQDYILKPRLRSPIATVTSKYNANSDSSTNLGADAVKIYFGVDLKNPGNGIDPVYPSTILVNYISKPAKVRYGVDLNAANIDCDLPEHMHVDILKHAVDLYRVAIQGSLYANQQQQQAQQREVGRNNVRPDNEGYTQ